MILKGDTFYDFKIGLKGLVLLGQSPSLNVKDNLDYILYCGLIGQHPTITIDEIQKIEEKIDGKTICSLQEYINKISLVSQTELIGLYSKCGEMGISLSEFFSLSLEEIEWMYQGYLNRKELECNLFLIAINQSKNRPKELVSIADNRGVQIGSQEERDHTFMALGINEV